MAQFLCEYKYFFSGVKYLRFSTTRAIEWMQRLDLILYRIPIIYKFQLKGRENPAAAGLQCDERCHCRTMVKDSRYHERLGLR
jgi:hypothetical protein